jgi:hypothetical protein
MTKRAATRVADLLNPAAMLLPAANVIMQLSLPGVGYGVLESPADSGNVYKHPFKRARTTGHLLGGGHHRKRRRPRADSRSRRTAHRQVRSTASSPMSYNAFGSRLQLWIAACLYRYFVRDDRLSGTGVSGHDGPWLGGFPAAALRVALGRAAAGRSTHSGPCLDSGISDLSVGHAVWRAARMANRVMASRMRRATPWRSCTVPPSKTMAEAKCALGLHPAWASWDGSKSSVRALVAKSC